MFDTLFTRLAITNKIGRGTEETVIVQRLYNWHAGFPAGREY